ncbi:hypothetical protein Halha_0657 [Halobacteroides halobius DSM 5150]|uniref:Magnesium transporter MgtE intracellular domain-containing protein n=1 Tax=Halobacteroides halobius (strain ATCC 35273 / DSM 5150 / MD-1) TaxID=748449 RepID=L0K7V2_HALHC|nr:hypothetical protein [Halobacteroides halobius]AGB40630.1 hypothetical protein Halha_0657 [Halobacteroides halobius DSM 5150]
MKKIFFALIILIVLAGLTLYLLDFFKVFTFAQLQQESLEQLEKIPAVKEYMVSKKKNNELQDNLEKVRIKLSEMKEKNKQLLNQLQNKEQDIKQLQGQIKELEKRLRSVKQQQEEYTKKIERLVGIYSEMEPSKAADILPKLKTTVTVDILKQIDQEIAAEILGAMPTDIAVSISSQLSD